MNYNTLTSLLNLANDYNNTSNYDEAAKHATTVLAALEHESDSGENQAVIERKTLHCSALIVLADTNWRRGDFQAALSLARTSLDIAEEYNLSQRKAIAWNMLGLVSQNLGAYDKALEYYQHALATHKERAEQSGVARVTGNIGIVYHILGSYDKALEYYQQALAAHTELGEQSIAARVTGNIGNLYKDLGSYDKALEYFEQAFAAHQALGEKSFVARVTGNMGIVYHFLGSYDKALEYLEQALATHKELGGKSGVAIVTGNMGIVYKDLGSYDNALEYYQQALATSKELGDKSGVASVTGNIGELYKDLGSYDNALEYLEQALATYKELGEKSGIALATGSIGILYADEKYQGFDAAIAEEFLHSAIAIGNEIGAQAMLFKLHKSLADLYEHEERWKESQYHLKKYIEIKDDVNIEETKKQDAISEQRKIIELAKATADAKHQATEQLLHNVLPPSIAHKMLDGSTLIAEKLPNVSVLFTDIVGFTHLSQRITPEELVEGLDGIFSTFDALAEKHGLEKIKTIGDAYMVVAGAPVQREDHAEAMAGFALEMVEAMKEFRSLSIGEELQLRIGIHSGEVVAGVIGKKKFAYDLWGDAVNTASRMESHGEPGKIHCSEEFMTRAGKNYVFQERGSIDIKGKGIMKTYFLKQRSIP